jgi:hypothetical protein
MLSLTSKRRQTRSLWHRAPIGAVFALLCLALAAPALAAKSSQTSFASPEQAVDGLVAAMRASSTSDLIKVLGPDSKSLVSSGDRVADSQAREKFLAAYRDANKIVKQGDSKAVLVIGQDEWPFPIPVVKSGAAWHFDTKAGKEEILNRRIGANELGTIDVCHAYVDAQRDYATKDRNNDGFIEYAQRFLSSPGKHDGLYWPAASGEEESPMGPLIVSAQAQGYKAKKGQRTPYRGYYYKILTGQGSHAPGGAVDYVIKGHMIGGFALVAYPAQYGASGIMSFIVNHDDVVYQKDLGPNTAAIANRMTRFDPGEGWTKVP